MKTPVSSNIMHFGLILDYWLYFKI